MAIQGKVRVMGDLETFLRRELPRGRQGGYINRMELANYNIITGVRADACQTWDVPEEKKEDENFDYYQETAKDIERAAEEDCSFYVGPQVYELRCFVDGSKKQCCRFNLQLEGTGTSAEQQLAGTERGSTLAIQKAFETTIAQNVRMAEKMLHMADRVTQILDPVLRENERLGTRVNAMEETHLKAFELTEKLLTEQHVRELHTQNTKFRHEQMSELVQSVKPLIPVAINKWRGEETIPGAKSPMDVMMARLIDELLANGGGDEGSAEKFTSFIEGLPVSDEMKMSLGLLFMQEFQKAQAKRQAKANNAQPNGAAH